MKIKGEITGVRALAKLPYNCTIANAKALDVTPEEFEKIRQRNAASMRALGSIDRVTASRNTTD
jgi:hypothetical protein